MSQRRRFSLSGFRFLMKPGQFTGGNSERFREQAKGTKFFLRMFGNDLRFLGYLLFRPRVLAFQMNLETMKPS